MDLVDDFSSSQNSMNERSEDAWPKKEIYCSPIKIPIILESWDVLLRKYARISLIYDFAPSSSFNIFYNLVR